MGHGLGGNHAIRARGCHVSSASCAWIGLCSCTLQVWADFCALKDTSCTKSTECQESPKREARTNLPGLDVFFQVPD